MYIVGRKTCQLTRVLCQILTDFKNSFMSELCGEFAITQLLNIPPHLNCVATLPREIQM